MSEAQCKKLAYLAEKKEINLNKISRKITNYRIQGSKLDKDLLSILLKVEPFDEELVKLSKMSKRK